MTAEQLPTNGFSPEVPATNGAGFLIPVERPSLELVPPIVESVIQPTEERSEPVDIDPTTLRAMRLHAETYLREGFINEDDVNEDGLYIDEYAPRSEYRFMEAARGEVACRYIRADKKAGIMSLPTAKNFSIDPAAIKEIAGVKRLSDLKANQVIELSGLASRRKITDGIDGKADASVHRLTEALYISLLRESVENNYKLWLMNIDEPLRQSFQHRLGGDQVHAVGEEFQYMGPPTVPVAINPFNVVESILEREPVEGQVDMVQKMLKRSLDGIDARHVSKKMRALFDKHDISYERPSSLKRLATDPRTYAYSTIVGYSTLRALPVGAVEQFDGSVPLLWGIDIATAVPYTWGLIEAVSAKSMKRRALGAAVAAGSFVAPYAYFAAEGDNYPPYVTGAVAGMIGLAGLLETTKIRKDRQIKRDLLAAPEKHETEE